MIQKVIVLGAGSAGLLAALTLKRKIPTLDITILRSPEIAVIGVGEGTTPNFPVHLFDYMGLSRRFFYTTAEPTWKIGVSLIWGPRGHPIQYGFGQQADAQWFDLPRAHGFYCDENSRDADLIAALMARDKVALPRGKGGGPELLGYHAFHIENKRFIETLKIVARTEKIPIIDGKVQGTRKGPEGIAAIILEDGRELQADLFVDCSGFRSELLGKAMEEQYISFSKSLFCDRACIGGWERTDEPIIPYTLAETMDAGWCWRIDHEHIINRGYVYSSAALSDDAARKEFLRKNPKALKNPGIVKFRSGCYQRTWVGNVVAIGNSAGFVEPLEATALMTVCDNSRNLTECLITANLDPTPAIRDLYNKESLTTWLEIRNFLSIHYRFNTMLDTPFWQHCRNDADVSGISELLDFYSEFGPSRLNKYFMHHRWSNFGLEGFLVHLIGNKVPYRAKPTITEAERKIWEGHRARWSAAADAALTSEEALAKMREPGWKFSDEGK